jgi:hypothetical protein
MTPQRHLPNSGARTPPTARNRLGDASERTERTPTQPGSERPALEQTLVCKPVDQLLTLSPDDRALVAFCCALRSQDAQELLEQIDPMRATPLVRAAAALCGAGRPARIGALARHLSPRPSEEAAKALRRRVSRDRVWFSRLASDFVPVGLRLAAGWNEPSLPAADRRAHPALQTHARRFVARSLGG